MIIVDSTVVNVAIPSIVDDLDVPITTAQWATSIYSLVFAALLITFGRMADVYGRRRTFIAGIGLFLAASLLAGLAPTGGALVAARFAQGVAGALILPGALSSLNATFRGSERAIAFGIWGAVIGGMVALGPLLGGWFTTHLSWRWAFFVNVPIGMLAITGVMRWVQETRDPRSQPIRDPWGVITSSLGLGLLVFATIEGNMYGWWAQRSTFKIGSFEWPEGWVSVIPLVYAASVALLAAFGSSQRRRVRRGRPVLMDFSLYRLASFRNGNFAAMIVSLGELGMVFIMPLYLQNVLNYSAFDTGVLLLALSLGAFVAGGSAAHMTKRIGARRVVIVGFALEVLGIMALGFVASTTVSGWVLAPFLCVYGLGVGFATAQLTSIVLRDVPIADSGLASGLQSTTRQLGAALGIAILGSLFVLILMTRTETRMQSASGVSVASQKAVVKSITRTGGAVDGTEDIPRSERSAAKGAVDGAIVDAARISAWSAAGFVFLGLLAALRLPADPINVPLGDPAQGAVRAARRRRSGDPTPDPADVT